MDDFIPVLLGYLHDVVVVATVADESFGEFAELLGFTHE
jgi:hypothetical protein